MFCVYLTTYFGDKMPNFYIGSSSLEKVNSGYRGSVVSLRWQHIWRLGRTMKPRKEYTQENNQANG